MYVPGIQQARDAPLERGACTSKSPTREAEGEHWTVAKCTDTDWAFQIAENGLPYFSFLPFFHLCFYGIQLNRTLSSSGDLPGQV